MRQISALAARRKSPCGRVDAVAVWGRAWPFDGSRKGMKLRAPKCRSRVPGKTWRHAPGRPARKKHAVRGSRFATQLACRLDASDDKKCKWLLRATRNSGEVRNPGCQRQSARTTARRLAPGSPSVAQSAGRRPGVKATRRPMIAAPGGGPRAEPVESQKKFASLKSDWSRMAGGCSPPSLCSTLRIVRLAASAESRLWRPRIRFARSGWSAPS